MDEQRDFENKWNTRSHSRSKGPQEEFKEAFEVISSFSYASKCSNKSKSTKKNVSDKPQDRQQSMEGSSTPNRQTTTQYYFQKEPRNSPNAIDEKRGLTGWLLTGRGLQAPLEAHKRSNSWTEPSVTLANTSESEQRFCAGLNTYPPYSVEKCTHPEHSYPNTDDRFYEEPRSHSRSFSTRPLGETWGSHNDWQKTRHRTSSQRNNLNDVLAGGASQNLPRMRSSPSSLNRPWWSLNELKRVSSSSSSSSNPRFLRSRSVSLPVQTRFECHVVADWEERRNNGVTYVTPYLKKSLPDQ